MVLHPEMMAIFAFTAVSLTCWNYRICDM
jgi:hypothetical protein